METGTAAEIPYLFKAYNTGKSIFRSSLQAELIEANPVYEKLANEGCENFYNYIEWLGLAKDPNVTVLSSSHHYFYDTEELKKVKTMVNLKQLNYIRQIKDFLHTIFRTLPLKSYFLGCFIENKNQDGSFLDLFKTQNISELQSDEVENGISSKVPFINMMYNILDARTNRHLSKRTVSLLLGNAGLKVLDMTELNGLTYFCAQKVKQSSE
jgi:hypothetical protein